MNPFIILLNFTEHTKTYTFLRHHTTVQWVCQLLTSQAAPYHRQSVHGLGSCQWKGGDRMESVLGKNWFTFSQHDKWWISTNSLGKINCKDFRLNAMHPPFLCSGRPQDWSWDLYLLFPENAINTLLLADLLGSFEHVSCCQEVVHRECIFYPFHKLTCSYSQTIRIMVGAWLSFLYCAEICQEIKNCIFSLWTLHWLF